MVDVLPLNGLRIVVTRPVEQATALLQQIEQAGGCPVLFPLLEIGPVPDESELREQLSRLDQFDLAIFISPNAVKYGLSAIRQQGALPDSLRIATVGQGSAKALRERGVVGVIAPQERFDSEGLLSLPDLQQVAGWRVMIFRGDGGRDLLGDTLIARGATVEYAACYQRRKSSRGKKELLAAKPDAITVTSSEALNYLWQMLDDEDRDDLCNVPLFVPHPRIAGLATEQGWRQVRQTGSGDEGLFVALIEWAGQKPNASAES